MSRLISVARTLSFFANARRGATLAPLAAVLVLTGCGKGEPARIPVFPVSGQVRVEGDSASGAVVVFHSVSKATPPAIATADREGRFKLTTYDTGDGAPAGEYAVTVSLRKLISKEGSSIAGPNVLPEKFASPTTTPFKVTVAATPNELKPFVVTK